MFKNREIRVRIAKTEPEIPDTSEKRELPTMTKDEIALVKDMAKTAAIFIGGVWLTGKVIDGACTIVVKVLDTK